MQFFLNWNLTILVTYSCMHNLKILREFLALLIFSSKNNIFYFIFIYFFGGGQFFEHFFWSIFSLKLFCIAELSLHAEF